MWVCTAHQATKRWICPRVYLVKEGWEVGSTHVANQCNMLDADSTGDAPAMHSLTLDALPPSMTAEQTWQTASTILGAAWRRVERQGKVPRQAAHNITHT